MAISYGSFKNKRWFEKIDSETPGVYCSFIKDKDSALYQEFKAWEAAGGVVTELPDLEKQDDNSDADIQPKQLRAILRCIADVGSLTNNQVKQMYKTKYENLP